MVQNQCSCSVRNTWMDTVKEYSLSYLSVCVDAGIPTGAAINLTG